MDWRRLLALGESELALDELAALWADARLPEGLAPDTTVGVRSGVGGAINWDVCERLGYAPSGRGKGSHEVWAKHGARPITVPRRKDLTPGFLSDLALKLGLDSTVELVAAVRTA